MVILGLEDTKRLGAKYSGTGDLAPVFRKSGTLRWSTNSRMWFYDHRNNQNYTNKPRVGDLP